MEQRSFPADVVGVIAEFTAESGTEAFRFARVSSAWMQGVQGADELWDRLTFEQWGGRKRRGGFPMYRARMTAALAYRPLEPAQLHAIEDCDFAFKCPLVAEALKPTGRTSESGNAILHCSVCKEDVYVVSNQEDLNQRRAERRCVAMKVGDLETSVTAGAYPITLCVEDTLFAQKVLSTLKSRKVTTLYDELRYSINFTGMVVAQHEGALAELSVVDLSNVDSTAEDAKAAQRPSYVYYQGAQLPPEWLTRGLPEELIVQMNDVETVVKALCQRIDEFADERMSSSMFVAGDMAPPPKKKTCAVS